jgi:asparagine synthase (glutamine-hydrolysing)
MMYLIQHRGPDESGEFLSGPVGLGHRRLSIIDINTGAQPMCNEDGSIWVVFNGEIYNFDGLRHELIAKGHQFKSSSDTEVIVHLYEELGDDCVSRFQGCFHLHYGISPVSDCYSHETGLGSNPYTIW